MDQRPPHNANFYFEYHRIGDKAFRDRVRFYEENRTQVGFLTYEERIDVDLDYLICLFEIGKYHKFLSKVDPLIETVIMDNIFTYNGSNIYNELLFKKAACLFNTGQFAKADSILKSIAKLEPDNTVARSLYGKCKRKQERDWYETVKAVAVVMLLSAVLISIMDLLIVRPFFHELTSTFASLKVITAILGVVALVGNEAYLNYVVGKEIGYRFNVKEIWSNFRGRE